MIDFLKYLTCGLYSNSSSSKKYQLTETEIQQEINRCRKNHLLLQKTHGVKLIKNLLTVTEINTTTAHGDLFQPKSLKSQKLSRNQTIKTITDQSEYSTQTEGTYETTENEIFNPSGLTNLTECFHYHGSKKQATVCRIIIVGMEIIVFGKKKGKPQYLKIPLMYLDEVYKGHDHPFWKKNGTNEGVCLSLEYKNQEKHQKIEHFAFENEGIAGGLRTLYNLWCKRSKRH